MKEQFARMRWIFAAVTLLLALASVPAIAGQRPLSDFTSRQSAWCAVVTGDELDCGASYYGGPDCLQGGVSFTFPQEWSDPKTGLFASIDALGQFDDGDFGTIVDGSISEAKSPGGLANVNVTVHTSNALMRAYAYDPDFNAIPLFGHLFGEVLEGAPPTLGDSLLKVSFTNTAPGAPLPDFFQMAFCPAPGQALQLLAMRARASGPLREAFGVPEGTPGMLEVTQNGLIGTAAIANPNSRVGLDAFPAEHVIIRATGK
jgi:hypothetical protein